MGYYISKHSIDKVREYLDVFPQLTYDREIRITSLIPDQLSYDIKQGLKSAHILSDPLGRFHNNVIIRIDREEDKGHVIIALKKTYNDANVLIEEKFETNDVREVIDAIMYVNNAESKKKVYFPHIKATSRIVSWADNQGNRVIEYGTGILIEKHGNIQSQETSRF